MKSHSYIGCSYPGMEYCMCCIISSWYHTEMGCLFPVLNYKKLIAKENWRCQLLEKFGRLYFSKLNMMKYPHSDNWELILLITQFPPFSDLSICCMCGVKNYTTYCICCRPHMPFSIATIVRQIFAVTYSFFGWRISRKDLTVTILLWRYRGEAGFSTH